MTVILFKYNNEIIVHKDVVWIDSSLSGIKGVILIRFSESEDIEYHDIVKMNGIINLIMMNFILTFSEERLIA